MQDNYCLILIYIDCTQHFILKTQHIIHKQKLVVNLSMKANAKKLSYEKNVWDSWRKIIKTY